MTEVDDPSAGVPWRTFYEEARERAAAAGLPNPGDDARRIVEEAAGLRPAEFTLGLDEFARTRAVVWFDQMLSRRLAGEPLQYVVGRWGFRTLDLKVDRRALIPRPETEVVAGLAIAELAQLARHVEPSALRALDLGTGTGAIGLSLLAEHPEVYVLCTDRSHDALDLARANLIGLGRPARRGEMRQGDWFGALRPDEHASFHLIIANPPYVADGEVLPAEVADWEPIEALRSGADGLDDARHLIAEAPLWLADHGTLVLELGHTQLDEAADLARAAGFGHVEIHHDLADRPRGLLARRWP